MDRGTGMKKVIAVGNVVMGDDAIGVYLVDALHADLKKLGFEIIYGETDIGYCISSICQEDFIIIIDAAELGERIGAVRKLPVEALTGQPEAAFGHSISFLDLLRLYIPEIKGVVLGVQISSIHFHYGLSKELKREFRSCCQSVLKHMIQLSGENSE